MDSSDTIVKTGINMALDAMRYAAVGYQTDICKPGGCAIYSVANAAIREVLKAAYDIDSIPSAIPLAMITTHAVAIGGATFVAKQLNHPVSFTSGIEIEFALIILRAFVNVRYL